MIYGDSTVEKPMICDSPALDAGNAMRSAVDAATDRAADIARCFHCGTACDGGLSRAGITRSAARAA